MERETGFEPATSSLGIQTYFESKSLARFCCEFLNLQRLAESAFSRLGRPNEAQTRHVLSHLGDVLKLRRRGRFAAETIQIIRRTYAGRYRRFAPIFHDVPPIRIGQERLGEEETRMMSMARRIQRLEDRNVPTAQTESFRQLIEDMEAGRRRV